MPISSHAHVEHYENLNKIEFDIYRNNKNIGKHVFSFKKEGDKLAVESEINFQIKKLGVNHLVLSFPGTSTSEILDKMSYFSDKVMPQFK